MIPIYIDRLHGTTEERLHETLDPARLDLNAPDLTFSDPIYIEGKAYIAGDHLICTLTIKATATLPCTICNEPTPLPLTLTNTTVSVPLTSIRKHIYDLLPDIRETILLNTPDYLECHNGHCPERARLKKFLSSGPFSDLS